MTDIVERLRIEYARLGGMFPIHKEAADEIERLREQISGERFEANLIERMKNEIERLRRIEAAYNNLVQAEKDLRRVRDSMT